MSDKLTEQIIASDIEVHRILGPGLLESIYEEALCYEYNFRRCYLVVIPCLTRNPVVCLPLDSRFRGNDNNASELVLRKLYYELSLRSIPFERVSSVSSVANCF